MTVATRQQATPELHSRERVELILNQLDRLPTLPAVAAKLLSATCSSESSAQDVIEIIEADASITSTVLGMARRADLGIDSKELTVAKAVKLMGFTAVRNMVLAVQVHQAFSQPNANKQAIDILKGIWLHNIAVACAAELICERMKNIENQGDAFLCGLLHDVGKIALNTCLPKSYGRVFDRVEKFHVCICDAEQELFGLDHTTAGKRLLARWSLPQTIIECAWLHHQSPDALPACVSNAAMIRLVHLADNLVRQQNIGYSGYSYVTEVVELASGVGLSQDDLSAVLEQLPVKMEPLQNLLGIAAPEEKFIDSEALLLANQKLSQINTQLGDKNRSLSIRSTFFDTMQRFTKQLSKDDRIVDICRVGAHCVRDLFSATEAMIFVSETSYGCIHAGMAGSSNDDYTVAVVDMSESDEFKHGLQNIEADPSCKIVPATTDFEGLWSKCMPQSHSLPLWMIPIHCSDGLKGSILFKAHEADLHLYRSATAECESLSMSIGLAVQSVKSRVDAERMSEDLLQLNRRLRSAQKELLRTRSIGMIAEMAAGAAHEINNPLSVISGRAQIAQQDCENSVMKNSLNIIVDQATKASQIVNDLMNFAKPEPPKSKRIRLNDVLETLCQHWGEGCVVGQEPYSISLADKNLSVFADPNQFREIIQALVSNAMEAIESSAGHVKINSPSQLSDETVRIVIEDNGAGMSPYVLEHAVDPFFSNRSAGRGRGLGLSRAYRLADINGGRLWLESVENEGTTVTIELPSRAPHQPVD